MAPTETIEPTRSGAAAAPCTVLTQPLPLSRCCSATALHAATRARGRVLLASAAGQGSGLPCERQTLVVTRALLRASARGDVVCIELLDAEAAPLLEVLQKRLPGAAIADAALHLPLPTAPVRDDATDAEVLVEPSLFDPLRALLGVLVDRARPAGVLPIGLFGAFGYELVDRFEALGPRRPDPLDEADYELVLGVDSVRYDYAQQRVDVVTRGLPWEEQRVVEARHAATLRLLERDSVEATLPMPAAAATAPRHVDDAQFLAGVASLREHIAAGDVFQAVLSRTVALPTAADSLQLYRCLAARERTPYMFHLELARGALLGASPETFLRVADRCVEITPIAGTTARDADPDTDARLALAMLFDDKERAEHVMLLDLARNDVARVAVPGSTEVVQQFAVEKYRYVQHLVSRVRGRLRPGLDALHAYRAAANMGTLTGAPKPRAMQLVRGLEPTARGYYGGAVGYLLQDGSFDTCIAIRTLRVVDGVAHARAGAGVVWASDPAAELLETERKLAALRAAVAAAEVQS